MPWTLENAEERAAEAPRSFFIPPPEVRHGLRPGDVVKLIFRLQREDGEVAVERMWVELDGPYTGTLVNEPQLKGVMGYGDRVEFGPEHVCAYAYPEGALGYDVDAKCFVSRRAAGRDGPPPWLYRDADGEWQALTGEETDEELADPQQVIRWTLGYLTDRFPQVEEALRRDAPPETWLQWTGEGYE